MSAVSGGTQMAHDSEKWLEVLTSAERTKPLFCIAIRALAQATDLAIKTA